MAEQVVVGALEDLIISLFTLVQVNSKSTDNLIDGIYEKIWKISRSSTLTTTFFLKNR